jgi:hypothetical protein
LSREGKSVYTFITNADPEKVAELISKLPKTIQAEVSALSLVNKDLSNLKAKMILVHGLDDDIIHHTQSQALYKALPKRQADLHLVDNLVHVELKPGLVGSWRLLKAVTALLKERDALACAAGSQRKPIETLKKQKPAPTIITNAIDCG